MAFQDFNSIISIFVVVLISQISTFANCVGVAADKEQEKAQEFSVPLSGLTFPELRELPERGGRYVPAGEGNSGAYYYEENLPPKKTILAKKKPSESEVATGKTILRQMAAFLGEQSNLSFHIDNHFREEGLMGAWRSHTEFEFAYARPNRLFVSQRKVGVKQSNFERVFVSDGKNVAKLFSNQCFVETAPIDVTDFVQTKALTTLDRFKLDCPRILSMFDPKTMETLIDGANIRYAGEETFGDVRVHHVILDGGIEENSWKAYGWDLFIAQGSRPVPVMIRLNLDGIYPQLKEYDRFSDSSLRFTNWHFNRVENKLKNKFALKITSDMQLVDSFERLGFGELTEMNPLAGKKLPSFVAVGDDGQEVSSQSLIGEKPLVLVLTDKNCHLLGAWWTRIDNLRQKYGTDFNFQFLNGGTNARIEFESELQTWNEAQGWSVRPNVLSNCDNLTAFQPAIFTYDWYGNRKKADSGERLYYFIVGQDGMIQEVVEMGPETFNLIEQQIVGLLNGTDMYERNRVRLEEKNLARETKKMNLVSLEE
ncbi:MAG: DUF2092 domain-containing protein [Planctomycetota bacterium]